MLATPRAGRLKILGGYIHKTREREWGVLFWTRADSQRGHHQAQNWGAALEKKREKRRLLSTSGENTHANFSPHHFIFNWGTIGGFFEKKKLKHCDGSVPGARRLRPERACGAQAQRRNPDQSTWHHQSYQEKERVETMGWGGGMG